MEKRGCLRQNHEIQYAGSPENIINFVMNETISKGIRDTLNRV